MDRIRVELPRDKIGEYCRRWRITEFAVFGSALRDDFRPGSDIDVLVSFAPDASWSLLDHAQMQDELELILNRKVDLISRRGLEQSGNSIRRKAILESAEVVYAA